MDRRSIIVAGVLAAVLAVALGVGIALNRGGGGQSVRATGGSTSTSARPPATASTSTTATTRASGSTPTVPTTPKPTVVIQHPTSTVVIQHPTSTAAATTTTPTSVPGTTTTTTTPSGSSDIGITPTAIHVTVIADDPTVAQGVQAWATHLNQAGGLAKRVIRVDTSVVTSADEYTAAVATACATSFAVVGSSSRFDSAAGGLSCGIPELATRIVDAGHRARANAYSVVPAQAGVERVGALKRLGATVPGCCRQYVLVPTQQPERGATQASVLAATGVGFTTAGTPDVAPDAPPAEYTRLVGDLVSNHATFAGSGLGSASTAQLRIAAAANPRAHAVKAWYCDSRCADPGFLTAGGPAVDGQLIDIGINPLSDQRRIPGIAAYVRTVTEAGQPATLAGLEAYSAGLLFEKVARQVVTESGPDGLTRVRLLGAVSGVHTFTAGGILGSTDVGGRAPSGCYALLRVQHGHLVRNHPSAPTQLDCGTQNLFTVPTGG